MAIDPYSPCPGGLPKKVKFCCADLVSDLDKIERLREADQRLACLDHIEKLESKYPDRACLMTAKADLLRDLGRTQEAETTLTALLNDSAANPVALAEAALLACEEGEAERAMSLLQQALRVRQDPMPEKLVLALRETGAMLLAAGEMIAGRQLLQVYLQLLPKDQQIQALVTELRRARDVPLLFKEHWRPDPAPPDAAWKDDFEAALEPLHFVAWQEAEERLTSLARRQPKTPQIWRTLAILRSWLADPRGAAAAWREYAALDIPLDDAVEAEATAQLLDPDAPDFVDLAGIEFQIHDLERVVEVLAASPRCAALGAQIPTEEGVPPPKEMFVILDRPKQPDDAELDYETTPRVLGRLFVFGRETDREARLELLAYQGAPLHECQSVLADLTFGMLGPAREIEAQERVAISVVELEQRYFLAKPPHPDLVYAMTVKHREAYLGKHWPETPQALFGGKSPEQAASQPAQRNRVAAALLRLEHQLEQSSADYDFDALRRKLQLPIPEPPAWDGGNPMEIPVARLARVKLEALEEPQVAKIALRALMEGLVKATRGAMQELLRRTVDKPTIPRAICRQHLAMSLEDSRQKLEHLEQASRELDEAKLSSAVVDVQRLQLHAYRQEQQQTLELIVHLIDEHLNDREYGQLVIETLAGFGLVRPDGRILRPRVDKPSPLSAGGEEAGKIWTPDSQRPANKPSLWVPGS